MWKRIEHLTHCLLIAMAIAACASEEEFAKEIRQWKGATEAEVVSRFGVPNSSRDMPNGSRIIQYVRRETVLVPPMKKGQAGGLVPLACVVRFTFERQVDTGRYTVANVSWAGNDCGSWLSKARA